MGKNVDELIKLIQENIFAPIGYLLYAVAVLVFFYGLLEFMISLQDDKSDKRESGKRHMLYGVLGFVIMFSVKGIISMIMNLFGISADFDIN